MYLKKDHSLFLIIILACIFACDKEEIVTVDSVSLNSASITLNLGDRETLIAIVTPNNAENKTVVWSTSDSSVATIQSGEITAINTGTAVITAITVDGQKTASCTVTVKAKTVPVESVALNKNILELTVGESETLNTTISPDNATNKNITWTSSNSSVATVTNGLIKAVKEGTATINAVTVDGQKTAGCFVIVMTDPIVANFEIRTGVVSDLTSLTVSLSSSFKGFSGIIGKAWKFGISYGNNPTPTISDNVRYINERVDGTYKINIDINPNEKYYYRAVAYYDGNYYYDEVKSFVSPQLPIDYQAVDLGLSVKWSNCNLGASTTHEDGDYYAWGETETKSIYSMETYKYYDSNVNTYINIGDEISGTQYDAAYIQLGGRWRMPTYSEVYELYHECTWKAVKYNNKDGYLVTGKNGNSIFVVTVSATDTSSSKMRYSHFWTSTLESTDSFGFVYYLNYSYFTVSNTFMAKSTSRTIGLPIRPVYD